MRFVLCLAAVALASLALLPACTPSGSAATPAPGAIRVPAGYRADPFVTAGLAAPTVLSFGPDGRLYVAELGGKVKVVTDTNGDGSGDKVDEWLGNLFSPLGLAWIGDTLYVAGQNRLIAARDINANGLAEFVNGDGVAEVREVYTDLGVANGQHQNNGLALGADGMLYAGIGGICNVCEQPNPLASSIVKLDPEGRTPPEIIATGFRNPFGLAFDARGQLWSTDNGADPPVIENAPDELNLIVPGGFYGYPWYISGDEERTAGVLPPIVRLPSHSSANTLIFYRGGLMPGLTGKALVAYFGPDQRRSDDSHKVVVIDLSTPGQPVVTDFATGFDRPLGMSEGPEGALYMADFSGGRVFRVTPAS